MSDDEVPHTWLESLLDNSAKDVRVRIAEWAPCAGSVRVSQLHETTKVLAGEAEGDRPKQPLRTSRP